MQGNAIYRERLWPGVAFPSFLMFMGVSLAIAYQRAYYGFSGLLTLLASAIVTSFATYAISPQIEVTNEYLSLGRASLPRKYVGKIAILDEQETKLALGRAAYASAFTATRSGIKHTVVVEVLDVEDPHPYWHFSTRNPQAVMTALSPSDAG